MHVYADTSEKKRLFQNALHIYHVLYGLLCNKKEVHS